MASLAETETQEASAERSPGKMAPVCPGRPVPVSEVLLGGILVPAMFPTAKGSRAENFAQRTPVYRSNGGEAEVRR